LNRKLLILNIALGAGVIYTGIELHSAWVAAKERQAKMPGPAPKAASVPPIPALKKEPAVVPSGYADVAVHDLFDASRNPSIPVDPPPPAPPPRDPPPLPSFHGMMDLGDPQGPVALITENDAPGHEEVHAGEMIGEFKLVAFNRKEMTLDWQGRTLHKLLNDGGSAAAKAKPAPAGGPEPLPLNGVVPGQAPQQSVYDDPKPQTRELGPGPQMTDSVKACQAGDSSAVGSVSDGFRKEINNSPMGPQCLWRAVGK
jgi:hypothetical protein